MTVGLYERIEERITATENAVRAADKEHGRDWSAEWDARLDSFRIIDGSGNLIADNAQPGAAAFISMHDPAAVFRRCAADRKMLERHGVPADVLGPNYEREARWCVGCGFAGNGEPVIDNVDDCPVLSALAEGYGLLPQ
ncbi:DUF6221 family protein [Streptomyces sp. PD-S100-1]|uniref:DUF6221 family protein n=1 Tax=Streptomyces sp. PD-S100-1 TaxID=3394351 RepID=UPI0039BD31F5